MLKVLAYLFLTLVSSIVTSVVLLNSGLLQKQIESQIRSKSAVPIDLGKIDIPLSWPLTLRIGKSKIPSTPVTIEFAELRLRLKNWLDRKTLRVEIVDPVVTIDSAIKDLRPAAKPDAPTSNSGTQPSPLANWTVELQVINGRLSATDLQLQDFQLEFAQRKWLESPAKIKLSSLVNTPLVPGKWPVQLASDSLTFGKDVVKSTGLRASLGGLVANVQGGSFLTENRHRWLAEIKAPRLEDLPQPPFAIPATGWAGAVDMKVELQRPSAAKGWEADGHIELAKVSANVKWKQPGQTVSGPVRVNLKGRFSYFDNQLKVPEINGDVDLTAAQITWESIFNKPPKVGLKMSLQALGVGDRLNIQNLQLEFWQWKGKIVGPVELKPPYAAQWSVEVPTTSLRGLENFVLPLASSPLLGQAAIQLDWVGPLTNWQDSRISVRELKVKDFRGQFNYGAENSALKLRGPIAAQLDLKGQIENGRPQQLQGKAQIDLNEVALVAGPLRKEAGQKLSASINAASDGSSIELRPLVIQGFPGVVEVRGSLKNLATLDMQVAVEAKPLKLTELRQSLPHFRDSIPAGTMSGKLNLQGRPNLQKSWNDWPLRIAGDLSASLPDYILSSQPTPTPAATGAPPKSAGAGPVSFLPKGELTQNLNLGLQLRLDRLVKSDLVVTGLSANGRVQRGVFQGDVKVAKLFQGAMTATGLSVPLLEALPQTSGQIQFSGVDFQDAMTVVKPEFAKMAQGRIGGKVGFQSRLPQDVRFMDELKANGSAQFEPMTLNSVRIGQMINELTAKIPGVQLAKAKVEPLIGKMQYVFTLANQVMNLTSLSALDQEGNELQMKGQIALSQMTGDLAGQFFWAKPTVKGCLFEGNADSQGRMVVPMVLKGPISQPQFSVVGDVIAKMAGRAAQCEGKKMLDKIKQDGLKDLEKSGQKLLQGIFGK